jgi:hypothetical protein
MKTYEGKRTIDGLVITADGRRLDEHYEVKRFTKYGFEWTYEGESRSSSHLRFWSIISVSRSARCASQSRSCK